jgi:fumarate reductase subunit D
MGLTMKRSNKPIFWSLFGAGGMLSALIGPMLVFITVVAVPAGWLAPDTLRYERVLDFAHSVPGKVLIFVVIALFLFHGMHRLYHTLHDFGVHIGPGIKALCHGLAAVGSLAALVLVVMVG